MAETGEPRTDQAAVDSRYMAAAIRLARRNLGLTATNPSVATLIVKDGVIVGRGITAPGGRPHAEAQALAEAGDAARGATAYVTLEPCAHHGRTPPCANALVAAGVTRVVGAASDPDPRVSGRGYDILRAAGISVTEKVLAEQASDELAGYLIRSVNKRPEVTLKLAVSADGMIGRLGEGQVAITGALARRQVHLTRAQSDAILVGVNTAVADDPELTCRLPGLEARSPIRIVLDPSLRLPLTSKLVSSARETPVFLAARSDAGEKDRAALSEKGVGFIAVEIHDGRIALPELLEDLSSKGVSTLMVEGGAQTARHFLEDDLVDRILLFTGPTKVGQGGVLSPLAPELVPTGFRQVRNERFGEDNCLEFVRSL